MTLNFKVLDIFRTASSVSSEVLCTLRNGIWNDMEYIQTHFISFSKTTQ